MARRPPLGDEAVRWQLARSPGRVLRRRKPGPKVRGGQRCCATRESTASMAPFSKRVSKTMSKPSFPQALCPWLQACIILLVVPSISYGDLELASPLLVPPAETVTLQGDFAASPNTPFEAFPIVRVKKNSDMKVKFCLLNSASVPVGYWVSWMSVGPWSGWRLQFGELRGPVRRYREGKSEQLS